MNRVKELHSTYNSHCLVEPKSSHDRSTIEQLPLVLNFLIGGGGGSSSTIIGGCWESPKPSHCFLNSLSIRTLNSSMKLSLSSWVTSVFNCSLNCSKYSWLGWLDDCSLLCDEGPKYDRIPTPYPATRTHPGCSSCTRATLRISLRPQGLKVSFVDC